MFLLFIALYFQTFNFGLCRFDDTDILVKNIDSFTTNFSFSNIFMTDAFTDQSSVFYRPLQNISFAFDILLGGGIVNNKILHITNVLYFCLFLFSLYILFKKIGINSWFSFLGCIFFAVNPLFTSSVSWIPARGDIFLSFFSVLSIIFLVDFVKNGSLKKMFMVVVFYTLALFSKETAIVLPLVYILYYLIFKEFSSISKKYIVFILILFLIGSVWFWLRSIALVGYDNRNFSQKLSDFIYHFISLPTGISQFFFPIKFSPLPVFSKIKTILGILLLIIIYLIFRYSKVSKKHNIFNLLWYLLFCLPVFLGGRITGVDYLDHRYILPMVGFMMFFLQNIPEKWMSKLHWYLFVLVIIYAVVSFNRTKVYKNADVFYLKVFETSESPMAYNNRGVYRQERGDYKGALEDYSKAIDIKPDYADAFNNRAIMYFHFQNLVSAYVDINKAIELYKGKPQYFNNRAGIRYMLKDYNGSLRDVTMAINIYPKYAEAYKNRASIYFEFGDYKNALNDCNKAIVLKSNYLAATDLRNKIQEKQNNKNNE